MDGDGDTDDGDEVLANTHHDRAPEQERATAEPLNTPHARERHEHVDDVGGDGNEERVLDARVLEEGRADWERVRHAFHVVTPPRDTHSRR